MELEGLETGLKIHDQGSGVPSSHKHGESLPTGKADLSLKEDIEHNDGLVNELFTYFLEDCKGEHDDLVFQLERQGFLEWPKSRSSPVKTSWMSRLYEEYEELDLLTKDHWKISLRKTL
ncbi:hypothetical protein COLO4_30766 [Corchorus olitorius]|uniref:Uncharacterized protein n=1 Tax=Corchorus olitorius TaxID=93759 RepID=A0A1R3H726_9ROSI|nr:hypothetical protein COLO4_30766 [Corchorus olitorius]